MTPELIKTFTDNFHYLNDKGKRNVNLLSRLFSNKHLTLDLEKIAGKLRNDLNAITNPPPPPSGPKPEKGKEGEPAPVKKEITDQEKWASFCKAVHSAFTQAQTSRATNGTALNKPPYGRNFNISEPNGNIGISADVSYKKPCATDEFETSLVQGLEAVSQQIVTEMKNANEASGTLSGYQNQCKALLTEIRDYKSPEAALAKSPAHH